MPEITGIPDLRAALAAIPLKLRSGPLRNALAAGARLIRDDAKRNAPVLQAPTQHRKPGTVRDAIRVRTSKSAKRAGDVGVFVNVKPAKGSQRGAKSQHDPFYWRWLEFGRTGRASVAARPASKGSRLGGLVLIKSARRRRAMRAVGPIAPMRFLSGAARLLPQALERFKASIGPQIQRLNNKLGIGQ